VPHLLELVPITIGGATFLMDLIKLDFFDFDVMLGLSWLHTYGAKINCEDPKVILKDREEREICSSWQR